MVAKFTVRIYPPHFLWKSLHICSGHFSDVYEETYMINLTISLRLRT